MQSWEKEPDPSSLGFKVFLHGMKTVWRLSRPEHRRLTLGLIFLLFVSMLNLTFPYVAKLTIDALPGLLRTEHGGNVLVSYLFLLAAIKVLSIFLTHFCSDRFFIEGLIRLENLWPAMSHLKLLLLPVSFHEEHGTGRNVSKVTKGCERLVDILVNLYFNFFSTICFWMLNLALLLVIDARIALLLLAPLVPALWLHDRMFKRSLPQWEEWESRKEKATALLIQSVVNVPTVQAYVQETHEERIQRSLRDSMRDLDLGTLKYERWYYFGMNGLINLGYIGAIGMQIYFVWNGTGSMGTLAYVIATGGVTVQGFWDLINVYRRVLRNMVAAERMRELLDAPNDLPNNPEGTVPETLYGTLTLCDVSFRYKGKEALALSHVNLEIPPGSMVAFVGKSGAGKTTLVKLILYVYAVTNGAIMLDGRDIRSLHRDWYRRLFASVKQDVDLFASSIRANIAFSDEAATEEEVRAAVHAAHLDVVLTDRERFPEGLDTIVGERGVRLSGGERQRVGIARAYLHLLRGARFLVLDEATSNLDSEAERAIQEMVQELRRKHRITIITIAHRLSTVKASDCIYVVEKTVTEAGTHDELLRRGGTYARLVSLQQLHNGAENAH